ncbi:c-type cytochrome biogenesis protein CcsB [Gordonia sp. (in: high G+C Gram-positive bacteria)]|uniref:c-type cytochrome biogenesis protein CcsB n=1 Tax=Gordonia sp. (in: high G+C Gram-positive bacteria) TaxID=84139 RepID=UPI0039E50AC0
MSTYVDETLGRYSDLLYVTSIGIYSLAALLLFTALAMGAKTKTYVGELAESEKERELVGAGASAGSVPVAGDRTPGRVGGPPQAPRRSRAAVLSASSYPVVILGLVAHIASIVLRGMATDRAPWGNMYEFITLTCAAGVAGALIVLRKPAQRPLMSFVLLVVIIMMFVGAKWLYTHAAPVVPALKSYWLIIHVSVVSIASGVMVVSGVLSLLFLVRERWPNTADMLPSAETLDRAAYRCIVFAFPLFGLGVICGAIWAEEAWGRFWGWDPKETVSFISWIIYAAYLHARATAGWRTAAAWINVAGFVTVLFNLFAINLVISGLHSYAGV